MIALDFLGFGFSDKPVSSISTGPELRVGVGEHGGVRLADRPAFMTLSCLSGLSVP